MDLLSRNPGLNEAMGENSMLSERDPAELKARDVIVDALSEILEPGERVVTYADRDLHANQIDALAYDSEPGAGVPDIMGYQHGEPNRQTDAYAYDEEAGRAAPDILGYQAGGARSDNDAYAYDRPPVTPQNDAFMQSEPVQAADVDFLVLTESRLIRGFLDGGDVMITQTPYDEPQVRVLEEAFVAVRLPGAVCGLGEGDWWCWRVPDGTEPQQAAKKWSREL